MLDIRSTIQGLYFSGSIRRLSHAGIWLAGWQGSPTVRHCLRATPTIMQIDLAFTKMHKTPKKTPPIVMHLDFAFYIAMHLEGETWHICQRSPAMQIEITGFSVPPRGLFSSLRAVSLRAATTSRDRRSIARPPSPASRARLDEAAHNRTTQRAIGRIYDATA
jgi:hypothetical protein